MKLHSLVTISLITLAGAQHAIAQDGKSRAQVGAELGQASRAGELLVPGELGLPLNQLRPDLYPRVAAEGSSRDQVKGELAEAIRTGNIVAGEFGGNLNELHPGLYPPVERLAGRNRDEAKAELAEALRTGNIIAGGELGLTRNQLSSGHHQEAGRMMARSRSGPVAQRGILSWTF